MGRNVVTETQDLVLDHPAFRCIFWPQRERGSNLPCFLLFAVPVLVIAAVMLLFAVRVQVIAAVMLLVDFLTAFCSKLEPTAM